MFILSISSGLNYVAICSWRDGWGIDFAVIAAMFGLSLHMVIPARVSLQRGKGLQVSPSAWALFKVSAPELIWQRTTQGHRYVEAKFMGAYYCNNPCKISVPPTYRLHSTIQDSQISSNHIRLGVLNLVICISLGYRWSLSVADEAPVQGAIFKKGSYPTIKLQSQENSYRHSQSK